MKGFTVYAPNNECGTQEILATIPLLISIFVPRIVFVCHQVSSKSSIANFRRLGVIHCCQVFSFFFSFYDFWRVREVIVSPSSIESFQGLHSMRSGLWTTQEPEPCVAGVAYVVLIAPRCSFILRDYFYLFNSFRFPEEFVCTSVCVLCTPVLTSHCTLLHFFLSLCLPFFLPDSVWISLFALLRLTPLPLLFFFCSFFTLSCFFYIFIHVQPGPHVSPPLVRI